MAEADRLSPAILAEFDALGFECDGLSMLLSFHLDDHGIKHRRIIGELYRLDGQGPKTWMLFGREYPASDHLYHVWIELPDQTILDLRARMWFGSDAPHGIFHPAEFSNFSYREK